MTVLNYNKEDAEQVVWDVFIALFEYNKENLIRNCKTFLYTTAHNKAIDIMKKKTEGYGEKLSQRNEVDVHDIQKKELLHLRYKQQLVQKYLLMLQPREKEVVHLFFYEDKSYEEISEILGTNKNTIGTILLQAKKKLKEFVQRENMQDILAE